MRAPTETSGTPFDLLNSAIARRGLERAPLLAAAAALATAASVHAQDIYVDGGAPLGGDGRSWATAYNDLQYALWTVYHDNESRPRVIKIASGVYLPDSEGDRARAFELNSSVTLMGGFAGRAAPMPDFNDPALYETVLSGDLARNDGPNWTGRDDNSFTVLSVASAVVMNLTIRGASGGTPDSIGGAITGSSCWGSAIELDRCRIVDNQSDYSAVLHGFPNGRVTMIARNTTIENNRGTGFAPNSIIAAERVSWERCTIRGNTLPAGSGALMSCLWFDCASSLIAGNSVDQAAVLTVSQSAQIRNNTFVQNRSGRGMLMDLLFPGPLTVEANIVHPGLGPCLPLAAQTTTCQRVRILHVYDSRRRILNNCSLTAGTGVGNILVADPMFRDMVGPDGDPTTCADNDYRLRRESPCVDAVWTMPSSRETLDLAGNPRRIAGTCGVPTAIDIGAYELQPQNCPEPSVRIYVKPDAPDGGDGLSWATAKTTLKDALRVPEVAEVWLTSGVYSAAENGDPTAAILLDRDVVIRGGFRGVEGLAGERPVNLTSIFWSSLTGVVVHGQRVELDRISVRYGNATTADAVQGRNGGGIRVLGGGLVARDCTFVNNSGVFGGAILVDRGSATLIRCEFTENAALGVDHSASGGGAIAAFESLLSISDCLFHFNVATDSSAVMGGAVYADPKSELAILRSTFVSNSTTAMSSSVLGSAGGGAVHALCDSKIVSCGFFGNVASVGASGRACGGALVTADCDIAGSVFSANSAITGIGAAEGYGGAVYAGPHVLLDSCTFASNSANTEGGALYGVNTATISLRNSILWNNLDSSASTTPSLGGSMLSRGVISRCLIQGWTPNLPGTHTHGWDPLFTNPAGPDVVLGTDDDDLSLRPNSPAIDFGDSSALPPDTFDLDFDRNLTEPLSRDYLGRPRQFDDVGFIDAGTGPTTFLDLGAIEFDRFSCRADVDGDASVSVGDLFLFLTDFFLHAPPADFNRSGAVTVQDLLDFIEAFVTGCP